ncbi:MAG: hypothetical protein M1467_04320 [Deltaproteobacteria bacterium]|jgi:hypothetical protein|nr:hypothetical protein [Deltaproteobacteria bacterium]
MNSLENLIFALENANELFIFYERNYADKRIKGLRKEYKRIMLEIRNINNEFKEKEEAAYRNFTDKEIFRAGIK